jgi:hypothetical protein
MCVAPYVKCLLFFSYVNKTSIFSTDLQKKIFFSKIKFNENPSSGSRVVPYGRTDRQADMTDIIVAYCTFSNRASNWRASIEISFNAHQMTSVRCVKMFCTAWPIPAAARSKALVCGSSLVGAAVSNPARDTDSCLLWVFVCCQIEVCVTGRTLFQRIPTECEVPRREAMTRNRVEAPQEKKGYILYVSFFLLNRIVIAILLKYFL